ncbi:TrmH family RNA methyltransferase [Gilvibacter sediminis]|uniref:TrmH family RNA methyltransferase n=1 Tax=Gilvibacter sediminis TaxID=379071 RepID=UPI00234FBB58|nr:TrmH family RNA methyltransferase [Gilvibacter sediminis]MDC7998379.1 TrmH family RNA methyltransferase [Gilvibacter sediminis]
MNQLTHDQNPFKPKSFPIALLTDGVRSPANIGGLFRLMDAFGIKDIFLADSQVDLNSSRLKRTARGTERKLNILAYDTAADALAAIQEQRPEAKLIALEITSDSEVIDSFEVASTVEYILVLGGELHGVSEPILAQCEKVVHIPMYGNNSSMNVTQSAAIALHTLTQKLL